MKRRKLLCNMTANERRRWNSERKKQRKAWKPKVDSRFADLSRTASNGRSIGGFNSPA